MNKRNTYLMVLLAPWLITVAVFWLYPLGYALVLSFTKYQTLTNAMSWVGLQNYEAVFRSKPFWQALTNTLVFTLGTVPVTTAFALLLATAVRTRTKRFADVLRASYFLPSVTSLVVIALIFTNLYSRDGYVNAICSMVGLPFPEQGWLLSSGTALFAIMAMDVWISTGYYMVLFLAAMEAVPKDLYESAELVGATSWQQFKQITLPLIRPTVLFFLFMNTLKSFQVFIEVYVMTKGGPLGATTTLVYSVYHNAFEQSDMMGYASALAWVVFIILLGFSLIQMKVLRAK